MRHPHRRIGLVDVLTAGAARAESIDAQIGRIDYHLDLVVDRRKDEHGGERGMAARVGVKRRDAHQAMDPGLGLEVAVSVVALDGESRALDSAAVARLQIGKVALVAAPLGPSQVQPEQHLGPVLRLQSAGTRMDRDDRPEPVVLAAEHHLQFLALDFAARLVKGRFGFARRFRVVAAFLLGHR